ncbi:hypothetical protein D0T49_03975 [Paludibacter sp. 221]|uniref:DUF6056 family protein n=1 Tax=Paludibacter sp. 221 TaxID=2302939 RepID=UPI0013D3249C|nr:DUF6056 family protein [Paludibacter sp. 221]NDV46199.1 hypothetical protein [Paludibacter sp. 221]
MMKTVLRTRINYFLLFVAALSSILFLFLIEFYNDITLDDIGFALQLQESSIWDFMKTMYLTWQGRFMGFFLTGLQMKSYFLFNSMLPFSMLLYAVNILLITKALMNFFNLKIFDSVLYSVVLFQIYIFTMFDFSSYFWMCTKGYTFIMTLSVYAFSELIVNKKGKWYSYITLFIVFAFIGCSYEIFAPIILLLMGCCILYLFYKSNFRLSLLIRENKLLLFTFFVGTLFFVLMVIAPGNWVRMDVHSKDSTLSLFPFLQVVLNNSIYLSKNVFFTFPYYFVFLIVIAYLFSKKKEDLISSSKKTKKQVLRNILKYAFISVSLTLVSLALNTYAVGQRMELRAFNHVNLIVFVFLYYTIKEIMSIFSLKKNIAILYPIVLLFVIISNIYSTIKSVPELEAYEESKNQREQLLYELKISGNEEIACLQTLDAPLFHSVLDDAWRVILPKVSDKLLLKPNEISFDIKNYYNVTYKEYYQLDFDVITDLSYDL